MYYSPQYGWYKYSHCFLLAPQEIRLSIRLVGDERIVWIHQEIPLYRTEWDNFFCLPKNMNTCKKIPLKPALTTERLNDPEAVHYYGDSWEIRQGCMYRLVPQQWLATSFCETAVLIVSIQACMLCTLACLLPSAWQSLQAEKMALNVFIDQTMHCCTRKILTARPPTE